MADRTMIWEDALDQSWHMELAGEAGEWLEVRHRGGRPAPGWRVEGRLDGAHYRLPGVFASQDAAQGSALLLAMRLCPPLRGALQAALGRLPGAWWWRITRRGDPAGNAAIYSSRVSDSPEAAERSGRSAGQGWHLHVHGPGGAVRDCGFVGWGRDARD